MNLEVTVKEEVESGGDKGEEEIRHETSVDAEVNAEVSVKEAVSGGGGKGEGERAVDTEKNSEVPVKKVVEGGGGGEGEDEGAVDIKKNSEVSVKEVVEGGGGGKGEEESKDEETESSEDEEEDGESSEAFSSSEEESSEATSSSDEEEQRPKKHGVVYDMESLIEEGELMVGVDDDNEEEEEAPNGSIKFKHEAENCYKNIRKRIDFVRPLEYTIFDMPRVFPPVPKIEVQLEPRHKAFPVGTISAIMGERVIVEGSVQHNPLNEGSVLWITESRIPLGVIDELFGPVKNPYYLVRYNSAEEVPAGICAGTAISFVMEFAHHILNMKELHTQGCDEFGDYDEDQTDEPEFSDDEKEAEYKRSLRLAKKHVGKQLESKKASGGKKRKQPMGAGFRKDLQPRIHDTPIPDHQLQRRSLHSDMAPASENWAHSLGPENYPMSVPTKMPPISVNPAMPSAVQLANQNDGCFISPSQQFLPQQPNVVWPRGLQPSPYLNMGFNGVSLAANIMQNMISGANQYQQLFHNQNFGGSLYGIPMPSPQFMPWSEMPASPMPFGGPPVNPSFGVASQLHMGQGNFSHHPHLTGDQGLPPVFANTQGCERLPPTHGDGDQPPTQFNSGQFNQGNLSFCDRKSQEQGGRRSPGKGGGP